MGNLIMLSVGFVAGCVVSSVFCPNLRDKLKAGYEKLVDRFRVDSAE